MEAIVSVEALWATSTPAVVEVASEASGSVVRETLVVPIAPLDDDDDNAFNILLSFETMSSLTTCPAVTKTGPPGVLFGFGAFGVLDQTV